MVEEGRGGVGDSSSWPDGNCRPTGSNSLTEAYQGGHSTDSPTPTEDTRVLETTYLW